MELGQLHDAGILRIFHKVKRLKGQRVARDTIGSQRAVEECAHLLADPVAERGPGIAAGNLEVSAQVFLHKRGYEIADVCRTVGLVEGSDSVPVY